MAKYWCYFLFLLWFSYLIVSSILLFTNGFLLTRITIDKNSSCVSHSELSCVSNTSAIVNGTKNAWQGCSSEDVLRFVVTSRTAVCLPPKARVVLLLIDAFRHDFALYDGNLKEPLPYQNKIPIISELLQSHPETTRLYKFIADPPTTTMQRLKALTTGSLPTFIDAGSNFATAEIGEDNIIDQLASQNRKVVFLGDDTWSSLYPKSFTRSYPFPSFNVWDLDTVDNGIHGNIFSELARKDWSLLVGHYLGVDHCGHRYGPNHLEMARKLSEMNEVIKNVTTKLDDDVILFVVGDHGMTITGDHGGESSEEITSAMFVYSKLPLMQQPSNVEDFVKQVDLIPTLSVILGIPIPYANLGMIILNCLPILNDGPLSWGELYLLIWMNVQQISTYIKEYSSLTKIFDNEKLQIFEKEFHALKAHLLTPATEVHFKTFVEAAFEHMLELREMCERVWVQFDSFSMSRGLLFIFLSLFLVHTIVDGIPSNRLSEVFVQSFLFYLYLSLVISLAISSTCYYFNLVTNMLTNLFFVSGMISIFMLAMIVVQNWEIISLNWYEASKKRNWIEIGCRFILLVSLCGFFSNSFVVEEAYVSLFLLTSLVVVVLFDLTIPTVNKSAAKSAKTNVSNVRKSIKIKLVILAITFCILVRLSVYFWQCREEHNCDANLSKATNKQSNSNRFEWVFTLISLALLVTVTRICLRSCGNLSGYSITVLLAQYTPTTIVVCSLGFWILHNLPNDTKFRLVSPWHTNLLAWIVYVLTTLGILFVYAKPLCIYVLPKKTDFEVYKQGNVIPQLFRQVKSLFNQKAVESDNVPIICGLATVYSASFFIASIYLVLLFALVLGNAIAPSAVLLYFSVISVLGITSISRYERATNFDQLLTVPTTSLLLWLMLSRYFFYGTGHQATFPNIAWEAAFVGTGGVFYYNFIPATLIIINTFGSYILLGFMLPLLQIIPFSVYVTVTSLVNKKNECTKDLSRGDILLYENDGVLLNNTFILCCKYLLCHAVHVFASMLSSTIHCRHLMVWKIFAPKFIFEAIAMFVTIPSVLLGYLLLIRINSAVDRLIKSLNKQSR